MSMAVILTFSIKPERAEEFRSLLKRLLPNTRAFEGCHRVDVYSTRTIPAISMWSKNWESKEHQQRCRDWRDETGIAETLGPFLVSEPRINYFYKQDI
ncbi:MAG: antibiotic biosynthesis monooxygenase [Chloroflexi bacterium]|nr:antibiotic biosynthesis monooxygenase [Chloroflexota bacterium]